MSTAQDLKTAGLKATVPRLKIINLFESSRERHLTAEEVYRLLRADGFDIGLATVYRRCGEDWVRQVDLLGGDLGTSDNFGFAVALHGDTVVAGAPFHDLVGTNAGASYVFDLGMAPLAPFCAALAVGLLPRTSVFTFAGRAAAEPSLANLLVAGAIIALAIGITWGARGLFRTS